MAKFIQTLDGRLLAAQYVNEISEHVHTYGICPNCSYSRTEHQHVYDTDGRKHAATVEEVEHFLGQSEVKRRGGNRE
jgi:translation initiation factor 2 beta subunit (eIF-2beta)/eIF-5